MFQLQNCPSSYLRTVCRLRDPQEVKVIVMTVTFTSATASHASSEEHEEYGPHVVMATIILQTADDPHPVHPTD